jgi:hypothetical protein
MDFIKKNDFIVCHKGEQHFEKDLELFKKHCPDSPLHAELKRVNQFTRDKLGSRMLNELLDKVAPEKILENRSDAAGKPKPPKKAKNKASKKKPSSRGNVPVNQTEDDAGCTPSPGNGESTPAATDDGKKKDGTNTKNSPE